jgi:hypothetical protein
VRVLPLFAATIVLNDVPFSVDVCLSASRLCGARCQVRVRGAGSGGWWRLKGCGNHEQVKTPVPLACAGRPASDPLALLLPPPPRAPRLQGFPAESHGVVASGAPAVTVRGCCFAQTAEREACMTYQVKMASFRFNALPEQLHNGKALLQGTFQYHFF